MPDPFSVLQNIAEQRIEEAIKQGSFENLPGSGRPLQLENTDHIPPELRMAYKILKNAGCLPPELAERKEINELADLLDQCQDEREKLKQMRKLKFLLERRQICSNRHMALELNDEYYLKILARLERHARALKIDPQNIKE